MLLEVHFGGEEETKKYHHPRGNSENSIRLWLQQWSMWSYIDHQGSLLVTELAALVFRGELYGDFSGQESEFVEYHVKLYKTYVRDTALALGGVIWQSTGLKTPGLRELWRKRTKRGVVRFFMHLEEIQGSRFRKFPGAMTCSMMTANKYSMYPSDCPAPEGRTLTTWETEACPWYMDFPDWNKYVTEEEKKAARALRDGKEPEAQAWQRKLVTPDETMAASFEDILKREPAYDEKKARRDKGQDDRRDSDFDDDDKTQVHKELSGSIVSPLDRPGDPQDPNAAQSARMPSPARESPLPPNPSNTQSTQMQVPLQQTQQTVAGLETQQRPIQEDQSGDQSAQEALPVSQGTLSGAQLEQQPSPINQRSPSVDPSQQHQSPRTPLSEQQQSTFQSGGPDLSLAVGAIETGISYLNLG